MVGDPANPIVLEEAHPNSSNAPSAASDWDSLMFDSPQPEAAVDSPTSPAQVRSGVRSLIFAGLYHGQDQGRARCTHGGYDQAVCTRVQNGQLASGLCPKAQSPSFVGHLRRSFRHGDVGQVIEPHWRRSKQR